MTIDDFDLENFLQQLERKGVTLEQIGQAAHATHLIAIDARIRADDAATAADDARIVCDAVNALLSSLICVEEKS